MKITQEQINRILENMFDLFGAEEPRVRTNYSGRGMYGKECVGFVVKQDELLTLGAAITLALVRDADGNYSDVELGTLASLMMKTRTDNMGYDTIVYFPGLEFADDEK